MTVVQTTRIRAACQTRGHLAREPSPYSEEGGGAEVERMGLYAALTRRLGSEEGATAVEYALMVALIALVIVAAVTFLGQSTNSVFENGELVNGLT